LRLFSFGGYGLALAVLALMVFGAIECPPRPIYLAAPKFASHVAQANLPNLALFQRIFSG